MSQLGRASIADVSERNLTTIGAMRLHDPAGWERAVRAAMRRHEGDYDLAAAELEVSRRTLQRWWSWLLGSTTPPEPEPLDPKRRRRSIHAPIQPRRISTLGALRMTDPERWEAEVRAAMANNEGRVPEAAEDLQVTKRTLFRWLMEPVFKDIERAPVGRRE